MNDDAQRGSMARRDFVALGLGMAAAAMVPSTALAASGPGVAAGDSSPAPKPGRRKLGKLEVSSVGIGVQNMSRKYETTVPYRPEMIHLTDTERQPRGLDMKAKILGVCLLIATAASPAAAQVNAPATANTNLEQQLLTLSREKWRLMAEKNADSLAAIFHEKAVFVHMGGHWATAQELQIIRSGGIWYKHAEIQAASVEIIGPTAIVLNQIVLEAVVGGNTVTNPFEVTEVYVQQGGGWKLAALSFTRLLTP